MYIICIEVRISVYNYNCVWIWRRYHFKRWIFDSVYQWYACLSGSLKITMILAINVKRQADRQIGGEYLPRIENFGLHEQLLTEKPSLEWPVIFAPVAIVQKLSHTQKKVRYIYVYIYICKNCFIYNIHVSSICQIWYLYCLLCSTN